MSILVLDDNPVSANLTARILKNAGYQTQVMLDPSEALSFLETTQSIELIMADVMMPQMDGLKFISKLKEIQEHKDTPVIMLSALSDLATVSTAVTLGCKGYLVKPVQKLDLLDRVSLVLQDIPPILEEKWKVMQNLGLTQGEYAEAASTFHLQLHAFLQSLPADPSSETADQYQPLVPLAESATILGAHRFLKLFAELQPGGGTAWTQRHGSLRRILTELHTATSQYASPVEDPKSSEGEPSTKPNSLTQ